ncbi:MAG: LptF/LptG family permease [Opitutales bacterium]|nr:LptF/LptG family permease [Opitutales bacterium]MCH8539933.1 LptF/LptG family permease [Opitutales bacterium]
MNPFLLLHRFIFWNLLLAIVLAVGIFSFLLVSGRAMEDVLMLFSDGRLSPVLFGQLIVLLIPYLIAFALPMGILTAVLLVLGRLSSQLELTAMRSAGMSLWQICRPVFLLAFLGAVLTISINLYFAPQAREQYRQVLHQTIQDDPLVFVQEGVFVRNFPGFIIYVDERVGNELRGIRIWDMDENQEVVRMLRAESGGMAFDEENGEMVLSLYQGLAEWQRDSGGEQRIPRVQYGTFEETGIRLSLAGLLGEAGRTTRLSRMDIFGLWTEMEQFVGGKEGRGHPDFARWVSIRTELNERLAMGVAVFSLALLGVPMAIEIRRRDTFANLVIALLLALLFYLLMILFAALEVRPEWRPDYLIWFPNILFIALGGYLFYRAEKGLGMPLAFWRK